MMNNRNLEQQFLQDVDNMLHQTGPVDSEHWTAAYRREMEIAQALATADFSAESRVRQTLKRQLLNTHLEKEGHMNTPYPQKTLTRLAIVGALSVILLILVSPLGTTIAQSLVQIMDNWQLGEQTTVVSVAGDFVAEQNENGETIISPAPEPAAEQAAVLPDRAVVEENQRHIVLDPTTPFDQAQAQLDFTLLQPAFIPEGYAFQGVVVIHSGQASLEYVNEAEVRLMGVLQTDVAVNGPVQVTMSGDILVENVEVNGIEAVWTQAGDEGTLIWEADGVNYQLIGLSDLEIALQVAESLK